MIIKKELLKLFSLIAVLAVLFSSLQPGSASAQSGDGLKRHVNTGSGQLNYLGPERGRTLAASQALGTFLHPQDPGMALAKRFGHEFGLRDPERELSEVKNKQKEDGRLTIRYQQEYQGIPVMGGELIVNTNENGDLYSINGEVSPDISLQTQPAIDSEQARQIALQSLAKWYQKNPDEFVATQPDLWIYDESLLRPSTRPVELVWRMEVTAADISLPMRELVLVNARRGDISLHFNQIDTAIINHTTIDGNAAEQSGIIGGGGSACLSADRRGIARPVGSGCDRGAYEGSFAWTSSPLVNTYTANDGPSLPGSFLCNQDQPTCTNNANSHADSAHKYAIGTYHLYATQHLRDSIDNNNMVIVSSVQYCGSYFGCPYNNAFWNGEQMVYGAAAGYPLADDVVAHELTHGVTQYESNLFYYYQSGAINESFSDLWGEYYDQTNSLGNDTTDVKWMIGEDVVDLGPIRSMSNPPAYGDPDRMSSPYYYEGIGDGGGVHTNSGVNNKAVYLMVDGGSFNSKTITALGWDKAGAIYYEAQTSLLTSGGDYSDLYYALQQACTNLIGQTGITVGDCAEVKDALDAVEMNAQPAPNFNMDAPLCTVYEPNISFTDDLENGTGNWTFDNGSYLRWQYDSLWGPYAHSGDHSLYADDYPQYWGSVTDARAILDSVSVPYNAYLHFAHAYDFEKYGGTHYDGGVLEYSTNGGANWVDASSLIDFNGYTGSIYADWNNPLKGRSAFVGSSHGYISTRVNLAPLAGQAVSFRWRMGLDDSVAALGWWVDSIKVYTCGPATIFADVPNTYWSWTHIESLYNAEVTTGCSSAPRMYCPITTVTRDQMAVFLLRGKHGSGYTPPPTTGAFQDVPINYWAGAWIEQLAIEGITSGCSLSPKQYCPSLAVTRDQMAVFLLRAKHGSSYSPPPASGVFQDVPTNHWAAAWIEQLAAEGITSGCSTSPMLYCPNTPVTRDQMAVFLVRNFNLPMP